MMEQKKPIRYSQKWARAVTFLSVVGVLLIPVGLLTEGVLQKVVIALLVAAFVVAWVLRVRYLTCQGSGTSCAPLMMHKGKTSVCPYCGTPYLFDGMPELDRSSQPRHRKKK